MAQTIEESGPNTPAIIGIGEFLVEIMRPGFGEPLDKPGTFLGPYASGAPAIFSIAAARLGLSTGFIGAVGLDAFGKYLIGRLILEGINAEAVQQVPNFPTGAAFVAYDVSGDREFVFHIRGAAAGQLDGAAIDPNFFSKIKWLHISGSTLALNERSRAACSRALELTRAAGGKLSLDPNLRPELMALREFRQVLGPYLEAADLILPTAGEARLLTHREDNDTAARTLSPNLEATIVLKQGSAGCTIYRGSNRIALPGIQVHEVDPTGAGDCFSAAFIAGLEAGWPLEEIGRFANTAGALAITKMGPAEGAPTRAQIEGLL